MSYFTAEEDSQQIDTHWMSESGIIDVFVMLGPRPQDVFQQYAALTGPATLPPVRINCESVIIAFKLRSISQTVSYLNEHLSQADI